VQPCGSYSAAGANLENLQSAGVVTRDARSDVRVRNPRSAGIDAVIMDDPIGQPWPAHNGSAR
jgi:hypothetical protein